jgi:ribonucleoside-diphosphate reductase alpha chain
VKKTVKLSEFQQEILKERYALPTEHEWEAVAERTIRHVVQAEPADKQEEISRQFQDVIYPMYFIPGGRVLYGAGRAKPQLLNCYGFSLDDNAQSIGKLLHDVYITSVSFGGCGVNYSAIRPKGDMLQGVPGQAPGVISEIRKIDTIGGEVKAGGARRAALLACLSIYHPDVLEFLHVKLNLNELQNHNISVMIDDEFLKAARKKEEWVFKFEGRQYYIWRVKRTGFRRQDDGTWKEETDSLEIPATDKEDACVRADIHYKLDESDTFKATQRRHLGADELLEILAANAHKTGEPGIINESLVKRNMATRYFERFASPNPCGEAMLPNKGNCCLGSINLSAMYDPNMKDVNWKLLAKAVRTGVRFLDDVLTINAYPLPSMREISHNSRRIGLGVMGLAYLLIKMGIRYGSDDSLEFVDRLMKTIRDEAFKTSIELAKEKGAFPKFHADKYLQCEFIDSLPPDIQADIREFGIRNAVILSIAPTGTISILTGCSSGIEPIFAPVYMRRFRKGGTIVERLIVDPLFMEYLRKDEDLSNFTSSHTISGDEHMKMLARVQQWVDQSISKTTNVAESTTTKGIARYLLRYAGHVKGWTIYRTGSRSYGDLGEPFSPVDIEGLDKKQILELIKDKEKERAAVADCATGKCDL